MADGDRVTQSKGSDVAASRGEEPVPPLFRHESLEAVKNARFGRPAALLPLSWTLLSGLLFAIVLVLAIFLTTASYTRKETANGLITSSGGEIRVSSPAAGVIQDLMVVEGAHVQAGDPIMRVVTARTNMDGSPINTEALQSIENELLGLTDRLRALKSAAAIELSGYQSRLQALQRELNLSETSEQLIGQQLALAERSLSRAEPVAARGFVSGEAMRRRYDEIIVLRQNIAHSNERQAELEGQISDLRSAAARRPYTLKQDEGELLDRISSAQRERDGLLAQRGFSMKAPASGTVTALQVSKGQAIEPQQALMDISSPATRVMAEVYVSSRAVGFLKPGQEVRVRYDAFPYQQFGSAMGTVSAISATVLRPEDVRAAVKLEEPMYRVLIDLKTDTVSAYGRQYRVKRGSALTADIIIDRRTFAQWLLDPLVAMRGRL